MSIEYLSFEPGRKYVLKKVPGHQSNVDTDGWPGVGSIGICSWVSSIHGVGMEFGSNDVIIPYEYLELYTEDTKQINDETLKSVISINPKGTLKLLRGLWRMTKHITIRDLMECGILPEDVSTEKVLKSKEECNGHWNEWDEYCRKSGMLSEGGVCISEE